MKNRGRFFLVIITLLLFSAPALATRTKEHSAEKLLNSCRAALQDTETFQNSFCIAYIEGFMGAKIITSYTLGLEKMESKTQTLAGKKPCANRDRIAGMELAAAAQYIVDWADEYKNRTYGPDDLKSEAFYFLEMIFFDDRYCNKTVSKDRRYNE